MGIPESEFRLAQSAHPAIEIVRTSPLSLEESSPRRPNLIRRMIATFLDMPLPTRPGREARSIDAVALTVQGIRGSASSSRLRDRATDYRVLTDISRIRMSLPMVWVVAPSDHEIDHVNIFRSSVRGDGSWCEAYRANLPHFCWSDGSGESFAARWNQASPGDRTLGALIELIRQFLNQENLDNPAR